jgi:hypothetical protein
MALGWLILMVIIDIFIKMKKSDLSTKEWQYFLVLKELLGELSRKEKNMKVIEWLTKKVEKLEKRSGW